MIESIEKRLLDKAKSRVYRNLCNNSGKRFGQYFTLKKSPWSSSESLSVKTPQVGSSQIFRGRLRRRAPSLLTIGPVVIHGLCNIPGRVRGAEQEFFCLPANEYQAEIYLQWGTNRGKRF